MRSCEGNWIGCASTFWSRAVMGNLWNLFFGFSSGWREGRHFPFVHAPVSAHVQPFSLFRRKTRLDDDRDDGEPSDVWSRWTPARDLVLAVRFIYRTPGWWLVRKRRVKCETFPIHRGGRRELWRQFISITETVAEKWSTSVEAVNLELDWAEIGSEKWVNSCGDQTGASCTFHGP